MNDFCLYGKGVLCYIMLCCIILEKGLYIGFLIGDCIGGSVLGVLMLGIWDVVGRGCVWGGDGWMSVCMSSIVCLYVCMYV